MWKRAAAALPVHRLDRFDRLDVAVGLTVSVLVALIVALVAGNRLQTPRLAYLASADGLVQNLYVRDVADPMSQRQVTHSQNGLLGYGITADGSHIFYSEIEFSSGARLGVTSFYEQDVGGGAARLLYTCSHAACTDLAVRPDGSLLAFQQIDLNGVAGVGQGAPRIWLLDTASLTASPLFRDNQQLGISPRWSPDGSTLAVYSPSAGAIILHNFKTQIDTLLRGTGGRVGSFSGDGRWLFYNRIVLPGSGRAALHTVVIDLGAQPPVFRSLEIDSDPVTDVETTWSGQSDALLIARQTQDRSAGYSLARVNIQTGAASELIPADGHNLTGLSVSPSGDFVAFQRLAQSDPLAHPELWLYNLRSGTLTKIGQDLSLAGWLS